MSSHLAETNPMIDLFLKPWHVYTINANDPSVIQLFHELLMWSQYPILIQWPFGIIQWSINCSILLHIVPLCFHFLGKLRRPHCDLTGIMVKRNHPKIQKKSGEWVMIICPDVPSISPSISIWLVVWNMNGLFFPIILGMSSSQLTFTPSFFRGVGIPPTRYSYGNKT